MKICAEIKMRKNASETIKIISSFISIIFICLNVPDVKMQDRSEKEQCKTCPNFTAEALSLQLGQFLIDSVNFESQQFSDVFCRIIVRIIIYEALIIWKK